MLRQYDGLTPLATLRLMTLSKPTKAPLSMNSTFEVSIWYMSGFAGQRSAVDLRRLGETYAARGLHSVDWVVIVLQQEEDPAPRPQNLSQAR